MKLVSITIVFLCVQRKKNIVFLETCPLLIYQTMLSYTFATDQKWVLARVGSPISSTRDIVSTYNIKDIT